MADNAPSHDLLIDAGSAILQLRGDWLMQSAAASGDAVLATLEAARFNTLRLDASALGEWDSVLVVTLLRCERLCKARDAVFDRDSLPDAVLSLINLSETVAPNRPAIAEKHGWFTRLLHAEWLPGLMRKALSDIGFVGEVLIAFQRLLLGRANMRVRDLVYFIEQCGPAALRIVTLISVLVGMILAYLGSVQLRQIGAQVYVADLVGLGMVREMGALMTAVIMAGRTGAAYAAQLGTMHTRDEIDAVVTMGISPIEFLVLPRLIALVAMMPLLCLYADLLGMLGGAMVALSMDVSYIQYVNELKASVTLHHISAGLIKSVVFGVVIALAGCRAGMQSGHSSESVGKATTDAVVSSVVWLVVADAALNILFQRLDF